MPRSTPRLVVYLLVPYLVTVPPLVGLGYVLARRAFDAAAVEVAGASALQEAQAVASRVADVSPDMLAQRCRDEVRGSVVRLTVIAPDGTVLCDTEADPAGMVNHLRRPEVTAALRDGTGIDRRESATIHRPLLYAAVRTGEGADRRVVRVAIPSEVLAASTRRLRMMVLWTIVATAAIALLPALYLARRLGRRLERMTVFARAVAAGEFSSQLPVTEHDELGTLERHLNGMAGDLERWAHSMREESEKIAGILAAMAEGVVVISGSGKVILMNRRAEELFGVPSGADPRGRDLLELCRDPELQQLLRATMEEGEGTRMQEIALLAGERRHLAVSVAPTGETGRPALGWVLVFHDISELKRLETVRRDFVANVSHELRTPLTAIRGYAEALLGGALADPVRARQFLEVIDRHAQRLSRLIDDLLALSDIELGKTVLKREPVALDALVEQVLEILRAQAARGGVALAKELAPALPPLCGDADRLQQVLINLVDNAVKYTRPGGRVTIAARPAAGAAGDLVEIEVADTGIGIPSADLPRLTERFYRVDKVRSRELGGTGLGLAIVKHLVQAHGGELSITSEVNVGTQVRFAVPTWAEPGHPARVIAS